LIKKFWQDACSDFHVLFFGKGKTVSNREIRRQFIVLSMKQTTSLMKNGSHSIQQAAISTASPFSHYNGSERTEESISKAHYLAHT